MKCVIYMPYTDLLINYVKIKTVEEVFSPKNYVSESNESDDDLEGLKGF